MSRLPSPYPYFGGKARVAPLIWERFGDVDHYVEPFFGSGAVLLSRPEGHWASVIQGGRRPLETINDKDAFITNFWRATKADPAQVAHWADCLLSENELHARHAWLVGQRDSLTERVEGDPDFYDAKIAGWWCWGMSVWIGGHFCTGVGPWHVVDGKLVRIPDAEGVGTQRRQLEMATTGKGIWRSRLHLSNSGLGIKRKLMDHPTHGGRGIVRKLMDHPTHGGRGIVRQLMDHPTHGGRGIVRQKLNTINQGEGIERRTIHEAPGGLLTYMNNLAMRFRDVRIASGDWKRVIQSPSVLFTGMPKTVGVFLDPPYPQAERNATYRVDEEIAHEVYGWAVANGEHPNLRIAYCYYEGQFEFPDDWYIHRWKTNGGYSNHGAPGGVGRANKLRETIAFSPYCLAGGDGQLQLWPEPIKRITNEAYHLIHRPGRKDEGSDSL